MAKKKTTTEDIVENIVTENENSIIENDVVQEEVVSQEETIDDVNEENELLKAQIAQMQAQMNALMMAVGNNGVTQKDEKKKERNIQFINLTNGALILKGNTTHRFNKQFESRTIREREAVAILNNMPNAIRSGCVYVADATFLEENDLDDIYEYVLTAEQLKTLFNKDAQFVIEAYKNASKIQKDIIIGMVSDAKLNGKRIDNNIVVELGTLSGIDLLGIEPMSDEN